MGMNVIMTLLACWTGGCWRIQACFCNRMSSSIASKEARCSFVTELLSLCLTVCKCYVRPRTALSCPRPPVFGIGRIPIKSRRARKRERGAKKRRKIQMDWEKPRRIAVACLLSSCSFFFAFLLVHAFPFLQYGILTNLTLSRN